MNDIHRRGEDLNYWFSFSNGTPGASGPCGPDSEIYYDFFPERGIEGAQLARARGAALGGVGYDDERFLEIWNLVFMRALPAPGRPPHALPAQNIDTGSGLERVACVLQGTRSVFETDIFLPILEAAAGVVGVDYYEGAATEQQYIIRAMSEHCRAAAILIGDGVVPSNEGRGYVLRRVFAARDLPRPQHGGRAPNFHRAPGERSHRQARPRYPHLERGRAFIKRALTPRRSASCAPWPRARSGSRSLLDAYAETGVTARPRREAFLLYDTFGHAARTHAEIAAAARLRARRCRLRIRHGPAARTCRASRASFP